jgi:hypothetical protein
MADAQVEDGPPLPEAPKPAAHDSRRSRALLLALAGAASVLAVSVALILLRSGGGGFPDEIGGYARITTPEARQLERVVATTSIAGVHLRGATYGNGSQTELILIVLSSGVPKDISVDSLLSGFTSSTGGIDATSIVRVERDGAEFACGRAADSPRTSCIFIGDVAGGLSFVSPTDPSRALQLAEDAYQSLT